MSRADGELPLRQSLLLRTTAALGIALLLAAAALVLLFRPFLRTAFEAESGSLLQDQAMRVRTAARADATATAQLVRTAVTRSHERAHDVAVDLPYELVTEDAEAVREMTTEALGAAGADADSNLDALAGELKRRTEQRLQRDEERVSARNAARAEDFGAGISRRAAALLLALVSALFLVHGVLLYRSVLRPVRRLSDATRDVARGELGTRLTIEGNDEVARLAASFNEMTTNLESARSDLESLNAQLEERVRQRTGELQAALHESREANQRLERAMQELSEKERELRQAEKMASLGTLAGGVAHEFNNLLGGILGCAEDAREDDPEELRETLAMIERTARRGTSITANLLRFARPGTGEMEDVVVADLLNDVRLLVEHEATRRGVRVTTASDADLIVRGEASGLHQVLLNLATNALHAMNEAGGTLTLSAESTDTDVFLSVADTGAGIAREHRDRLFEPFFSTRGPEGTGLGLSVSYGIAQAHGGHIDVESEPGRGSTFRVVLPGATRDDNSRGELT